MAAAAKTAMLKKYKEEIMTAVPLTAEQWLDAKPSLIISANELVKLEGKGEMDKIGAKKAEIIEKYKAQFKIGQEDKPRARSVSRGPAKTKEQREAELRAAAAAAKERLSEKPTKNLQSNSKNLKPHRQRERSRRLQMRLRVLIQRQ